MVDKKKPQYNVNTAIRSALRRVWLYSPERREVLAKARVSRGIYRCSECKALVGPKLIQVDHIQKATPLGGIKAPEDWGIFIKNLLFCGIEGQVALCKPCHARKTKDEKTKKKTKRVRISRAKRIQAKRTRRAVHRRDL